MDKREERRKLVRIVGSGGKGGGREPIEVDDNMYARQHAAFIDAIAEGPIKGLVYGDSSIIVDETRLRDIDQRTGQRSKDANMHNFRVIEAKGDATQTPNADFFASFPSASALEEIGSAELEKNIAQYHTIGSGTFEKQNTDYIKVTISTSGMVKITKKGDYKGDRKEAQVYFNIDFRWTDNDGVTRTNRKFTTGFTGKVSGKYAHTFGFNIETDKATDGMTDWAVKITRVGGDETTDTYEVSNAIYVDSIEASIADKLEYPYTAYIAGAIDAEQFNSIPRRGYEIDGKLIQIPSNHFPVDYNGRKVEVANVTNFAVGDTVKQDAIGISGITAEYVNKDTKVDEDGNADADASEGYLATATCSAAHGITVGNIFTATIDGASSDADFWEGTFTCEATTTDKFTYIFWGPVTSSTDPTLQTLSGSPPYTASGSFTASVFTGGIIDKIDNGSTKYLYLRNVSPTSSILKGAAITNAGSGSATVNDVEQVLIPANYRRDSSTEKCTAVEHDWDGLFYQSWCNNPAWVYNDLITNKIYGLGNYITQNQVNKWELYTIARYCDELVPAGVEAADLLSLYTTNDQNYTGDADSTNEYEPRFSANLSIGGRSEAFKVLNDVTSMFRGMTYWLNGEAYVVQDSEKDPVYQFTNGNVINGEFKYEGTAFKTRTNQIVVNWNNPQDYYRPRAEIVELEETLQKDTEFLKTDSITAFGCTSRGQARRLGKWKLLSNNLHTNTVTFSTSLNAAFLRPGDIIQVMDNHKSGKSWGGRIKSSSSTSSIKLDRQWDKETGYNYNDYQITLTFVGYKALLAQDSVTLQVGASTSNFVRGDEITTWRDSDGIIDSSRGWEDGNNDITVDDEEKAANVFDSDGNAVFVQWTPFTQTETKFIDNSDNSDPSTLTINTDGLNSAVFTEAPAADSVFIISRSALSTGKTKEEAKLYRVLQIAESNQNELEIQALEYNATKFDAVDKNEALSADRQIFLPSTFKVTPTPTNLGTEVSLARLSDHDALINRLTVKWDPPRNVDDNALYNFVRHYEVYYSRNGHKWFDAGIADTTSHNIDGLTSGTYHIKIFTVSVQGKRSGGLEGKITADFARAVGPSEYTVGYAPYFIHGIGNISGGYSENGGKVTFSPANQEHADGITIRAITGQPQLDFTDLDHTSSTGGNIGYIYMDAGTNKFIEVAFDETSGQFYEVAGTPSIFANATGTIAGDPTMISTSTSTPDTITGTSTNFDPEIGEKNYIKFTKSSTDYYHRIVKIEGDTIAKIDPPLNVTLSGQAFKKPSFIADYANDTIIGMVEKTGASAYKLTRFGTAQGEGAYSVDGTNESHTFSANSDGEISATNYSAYSNTYTVEKDGDSYTYAASGTAAGTFGLTCTAVTGFDATSDINISGSGVITIADNSLDDSDQAQATATIVVKDLQRDYTISTRVISFAKASVGADGAAGAGGNSVSLKASHYVVIYDTDGLNPTPNVSTDVTITADTAGFSDPYFKFTGDGITDEGSHTDGSGASDTFTYPVVADMDNFVNPSTVTVSVSEAADSGTVIATDKITIAAVKSGTDAYTVVNTNQAHAIPIDTDDSNAVSYTGSGTDIRVWKGAAVLEATTGTVTAGKFKVTASGTGITPSSTNGVVTNVLSTPSTPTNETIRYADHGSITADTAEIEYSIDCEGSQTITTSQTFNKNASGASGTNVNIVFARAATKPNTPTASPGIPSQDIQWYDDDPGGTNLLWASRGSKAGGATNYTWTTPFQIEGAAHAEVYIYRKNSNAGNSGGSYNFTNNTLTVPTNWVKDPPALSADGDKVYVSVGLATGASTATAASVTWGTPAVYAERQDGTDGAAGRKVAELTIYYARDFTSTNSFTTPSAPSTGTYNFSTATVASLPTGWTQSRPADEVGKWAYKSEALVTESSTDNVSNAITWGTPSIDGVPHGDINFIFRRAAAATDVDNLGTTNWPALTSVGGTWYDDIANVPDGSNPIWVSKGTTSYVDTSGTITYVTTWQDAVQLEGSTGATGATGIGSKTMYTRSATWPGLVSGQPGHSSDPTPTYTVAEMGALGTHAWSATVPAGSNALWYSIGIQDAAESSDYVWGFPTIDLTYIPFGGTGTDNPLTQLGQLQNNQNFQTNAFTSSGQVDFDAIQNHPNSLEDLAQTGEWQKFQQHDTAYGWGDHGAAQYQTQAYTAANQIPYGQISQIPTQLGQFQNNQNFQTSAFTSAGQVNITQTGQFSAAAYANAELEWGDISVTVGGQYTSWSWLGSLYNPSTSTQTLTMACTHPSFGTSVITGTWTRTAKQITDFTLSGSPEGTGAGASQDNDWAFGDASGESDNAFGDDTVDHATKTIYVRHESGKVIAITANVVNANFSVKCLTPAMLPENLQIGDKVDSPQGKTEVIDMVYKEREGYYILEDELEITNDHPILIDGEWILAEEYQGKKEYVDKPTEVVYLETENELLTVKGWTVGGKY